MRPVNRSHLLLLLAATVTVQSATAAIVARAGARALPPAVKGVQGVDDDGMTRLTYSMGNGTLEARYATQLRLLAPSVRRYNVFWQSLEASIPPSPTPLQCPPTHISAGGGAFKLHHCYDRATVESFDRILALDASIGAASAFITYGSPDWAQEAGCTGFPWPPQPNFKLGCLPWNSLDAYYDYILFLAARWNAPWGSGKARLSGICVWNEVQSLGWSDPSPVLPNRQPAAGPLLTPAQFDTYASIIANLTILAGQAAAVAAAGAAGSDPAFIWLSTDHFLTAPTIPPGGVGHLGLFDLLTAMWPKIWAAGVPFGIAVHPYDAGDPREDLTKEGIYTFATLAASVGAFQCAQLGRVGGVPPSQCAAWPHTQMWASEQGWPTGRAMNKTLQARNICLAHALSVAQRLWAVTHNLFQSAVPSNQGGGGDFSLIDEPPVVAADLSNGPGHATFDAYAATAPGVFGASDGHYCCKSWAVGCLDP